MQRLLDDFSKLFDLDRRVRGERLGDLVVRAIEDLDKQTLPDWGSSGPADRYESAGSRDLDFYYAPHLFPEMDLSLRLAHKLQFHLLPRQVPAGAPMSLSAVLESYCHLSGDLLGWEMLADGRLLLWIVDLSGHGVPAGLASAVLKVLIGNLKQRGRVGSLATELNENFVACVRKEHGNLFATGFFLVVATDGSACYTSGGHPPILLRRADGRIERLASTGLPLGMFPECRYSAEQLDLDPGDTLLLYTDGLVETANAEDEQFGLDRLERFLGKDFDSPRSLTHSLYRAIAAHQDMEKLNDDVTFVAARMG